VTLITRTLFQRRPGSHGGAMILRFSFQERESRPGPPQVPAAAARRVQVSFAVRKRPGLFRLITGALAIGICSVACSGPAVVGAASGAQPPAVREFERLWDSVASTDGYDEEFRSLVAELKVHIAALADSGHQGQETLMKVLSQPDTQVVTGTRFVSYYSDLRVEIIEALRRNRVTAASALLQQIVARSEMPSDSPPGTASSHPWYCLRLEAGAAARALGDMGQESAVPTLRLAFQNAFTNLSTGAEVFNTFPEVLIQLGDGAHVESLLVDALSRNELAVSSKAAYLAQKVEGTGVISGLIAYLKRTGEVTAEASLGKVTGQELVGVELWEEWWDVNHGLPRDQWRDLVLTPPRKELAANALNLIIQRHYLEIHPSLWWAPPRPGCGGVQPALAWVARKVHAIGIEEPVTRYLRGQLRNQTPCVSEHRLPDGSTVWSSADDWVSVADNTQRVLRAIGARARDKIPNP